MLFLSNGSPGVLGQACEWNGHHVGAVEGEDGNRREAGKEERRKHHDMDTGRTSQSLERPDGTWTMDIQLGKSLASSIPWPRVQRKSLEKCGLETCPAAWGPGGRIVQTQLSSGYREHLCHALFPWPPGSTLTHGCKG